MIDPLEALLVESTGIFIVQAGPGEPISRYYGTEQEAQVEAQEQSLALGRTVYVFRAVAKVDIVEEPARWTTLAAHGPSQNT